MKKEMLGRMGSFDLFFVIFNYLCEIIGNSGGFSADAGMMR